MNFYPTMMSDEDWQARSDARMLAEAESIKSDGIRLSKAQGAAAKMLEEEKAEKAALAKVAGGGMVYDKSPDMGGKQGA